MKKIEPKKAAWNLFTETGKISHYLFKCALESEEERDKRGKSGT